MLMWLSCRLDTGLELALLVGGDGVDVAEFAHSGCVLLFCV